MTSSFIGALGFKDLIKGNYRSGLCKMTLGVAGIASTVYYVYKCCFQKTTLPTELAFIESHKDEIEEMFETKEAIGKWHKLGAGRSKSAYIHKDFPGWVVKIPDFTDTIIRLHHENLEDVRGIASRFDRISLPESHLYPTMNGLVLVEEMFELEECSMWSADHKEARVQFFNFADATGLCDLAPSVAINAGILAGTTPPRMGIIDFDCRRVKP